jgi:tRNA modification GTPase
VASVLVEGPGAAEAVQAVVRAKSGRPLADFPQDRLVLGCFNRENGEEIVVRRRSPRAVELHCHGGYAATAMIEETLRQRGCRVIDWRQWVAESQSDPNIASALAALAEAPTERTAGVLLDQYHGALRRAFDATEQDIEEKNFGSARSRVESLSAYIPLGLHLTKPWRVVVAGPPNAGKSSLINAMVGFQRSIVYHAPGTTRDAVTVTTAMDGWPVELCDTAGLCAEAEGIEKAGVDLARRLISDADLAVLVFDLTSDWSASDRALADSLPNALIVHNKVDLIDVCTANEPRPTNGRPENGLPRFARQTIFQANINKFAKDNRPNGLYISALTGAGNDELIKKIADRLVPFPPPPGAAVPFTSEQIEQVRRFIGILKSNHVSIP